MKKLIYLGVCAVAFAPFSTSYAEGTVTTKSSGEETYIESLQNDRSTFGLRRKTRVTIAEARENAMQVKNQSEAKMDEIRQEMTTPNMQANTVIMDNGNEEVRVINATQHEQGRHTSMVTRTTYEASERGPVNYIVAEKEKEDWLIKKGDKREVWKGQKRNGDQKVLKKKQSDNRNIAKKKLNKKNNDRQFSKFKNYDKKDIVKVRENGVKEVTKEITRRNSGILKNKIDGKKTVVKMEVS